MRKLITLLLVAFVCLALPVSGHSAQKAKNAEPVVKLETTAGDIYVQLDTAKAPITSANFIQYVKSGHYDRTIFHRVIKDFMIQGGGMTQDMKEKNTRAPIRNEANNGLKNKKYTIAMARTRDPHSASAQFFINTKDNDFLDFKTQTPDGWGYAVFGKVIKGQDVVDRIEKAATGQKGPYSDVPLVPVVIKNAVMANPE